jgi:hypothetical protein
LLGLAKKKKFFYCFATFGSYFAIASLASSKGLCPAITSLLAKQAKQQALLVASLLLVVASLAKQTQKENACFTSKRSNICFANGATKSSKRSNPYFLFIFYLENLNLI